MTPPDGTELVIPAEVAVTRRRNIPSSQRERRNRGATSKGVAPERAAVPSPANAAAPPQKKAPATPGPASIVAHADGIDARGYLDGWAWVPDHPGRRVTVTVYIDEEMVTFGTANSPRDDLRNAGFGDGRYGFSLPLPDGLIDGKLYLFKLVFEATGTTPLTAEVEFPAPPQRSGTKIIAEAAPSPSAFEGHIDLYGYHVGANGWFFCGWLSAPWTDGSAPDQISAEFRDGSVSGDWITTFYSREDLGNRGSGMILFIPGHSVGQEVLSSIRIRFADVIRDLYPTEKVPRLESDKLREAFTPLVDRCVGSSRDLLLNLLGSNCRADKAKEASQVAGCVDGMEGRFVLGWAICAPDTTDCVIEVIHAETGELLGRGRATRVRTDLNALGYGRNNFGFRIGISVPADPSVTIRVTGSGTELPGSPLRINSRRFAGSISINANRVQGIIVDEFGRGSCPSVTLQDQDGEILGEPVAVADRNDGAKARFSFELPPKAYGRQELVVRTFVGDINVASATCSLRLEGFLDLLTADRCVGWLLSPDAPEVRLRLEVIRDGVVVGSGRCTLPRDDLKGLHPDSWRSGFDIKLTPAHRDLAPAQVSIRLADSDAELFDGPFIIGNRAGLIQAAQVAARTANIEGADLSDTGRALLRAAVSRFCEEQRHVTDNYIRLTRIAPSRRPTARRRLNVVIPVYRGVAVTQDCIESVLKGRNAETDAVILVNDCSPDGGMAEMLASYTNRPNLFLVTNAHNLGFIKSVNRALDFCKEGDVVLLNSDTLVYDGGLDEMWRVAHSATDIATVTAISNNATIFSYPHPRLPTERLEDVSWSEIAAAALRDNSGLAIDVPTGHGFCLLLRREILDRLGCLNEIFGRGYGEENEFCCKAADLGYRHVAAAGAFVVHRESVSFGGEKDSLLKTNLPQLSRMFPEYTPIIMQYERDDELRRARWALDSFRLGKACDSEASFALIVGNWLHGGTDVAAADIDEAVGYGDSRKLTLACTETGQIVLETTDPFGSGGVRPG